MGERAVPELVERGAAGCLGKQGLGLLVGQPGAAGRVQVGRGQLHPRLPLGDEHRAGRAALQQPGQEHGVVSKQRLSAQGIARVVQRAAERIGLDPGEFAGHSLRAGFATEAAAQGASERAIMRQTGHKSVDMVRRYIHDGDRYRDNAAAVLGL